VLLLLLPQILQALLVQHDASIKRRGASSEPENCRSLLQDLLKGQPAAEVFDAAAQ
jgi:hypothetical protein